MTGAECGFLLLASHLGNPERLVLSVAQMRLLSQRIRSANPYREDRQLELRDLAAVGYGPEMAQRILALLSEEDLLKYYLHKGRTAGCVPLTRISGGYPSALREKLAEDTPGVLWAKGDLTLLDGPRVALVGSRDILSTNSRFAAEVGKQAALQGYTLVSGNARGADRIAQKACLQHGGKVISVVADELAKQPTREGVLYISEGDYDSAFSSQRALSRNRVIHALAEKTFVAQCALETGGTWGGTMKNLQYGWSPVFCFRDGSPAEKLLEEAGAVLVDIQELKDISALRPNHESFF